MISGSTHFVAHVVAPPSALFLNFLVLIHVTTDRMFASQVGIRDLSDLLGSFYLFDCGMLFALPASCQRREIGYLVAALPGLIFTCSPW
jgi:hypothetical protein